VSILLFGVSHRSAPVSVLEQLSIDESDQVKIVDSVLQSPLVSEAMVLSTCNRVEVYAVVEAFHGGLSVVGQVLAEYSGLPMSDLTKHAYVRYSEAAVEHLFAVASGLNSAVVGEQQVLGQVRRAYASAEANSAVGRVLHELAQRALSVGKRVHSETAIDAAGASVVSVALDIAERKLGTLTGKTAVVVGAGAMGALAAAHLTRAGIGRVHVLNRSLARATRLADRIEASGVPAEARLKSGSQKDLGPGGLSAMSGVDADAMLFEVDSKLAQGKVYVRAFCPGSARLWLSFSTIVVRRDLRIQAFGDDPKAEGKARLCGTLDFSYRGEWRLPKNRIPDPMENWTDNPQHPDTSN